VRKLKQNSTKSTYDFIEVMACPGGCTNGGGQIGEGLGNNAGTKKNTQQVNVLYESAASVFPGWHTKLKELYLQLISNQNTRNLLHTSYHIVPKLESTNPLAIKW